MGEQDAEIYSLNINGIRVEDADTIASKINNYFVNIAQVLAEKISASPSDFKRHLKPSLLGSFGLSSTCPRK